VSTISGFHLGDEIDLRGLAYTSGTTNLSWSQLTSGANASGTLTVSSGAAVETLTLLGQYTAANFSATSDGFGGTPLKDARHMPVEPSALRRMDTGTLVARGRENRPGVVQFAQ
jgi:hypothetical protein